MGPLLDVWSYVRTDQRTSIRTYMLIRFESIRCVRYAIALIAENGKHVFSPRAKKAVVVCVALDLAL